MKKISCLLMLLTIASTISAQQKVATIEEVNNFITYAQDASHIEEFKRLFNVIKPNISNFIMESWGITLSQITLKDHVLSLLLKGDIAGERIKLFVDNNVITLKELLSRAVGYNSPKIINLLITYYHMDVSKESDLLTKTFDDSFGKNTLVDPWKRWEKTVDLLLKNGLNINSQDSKGITGLMDAVKNDAPHAVLYFMSKLYRWPCGYKHEPADCTLQDNGGFTALMWLMEKQELFYLSECYLQMFEALLSVPESFDLQDTLGRTAIINLAHMAFPSTHRRVETESSKEIRKYMLTTLLEAGADATLCDEKGKTLRDYAVGTYVLPTIEAHFKKVGDCIQSAIGKHAQEQHVYDSSPDIVDNVMLGYLR